MSEERERRARGRPRRFDTDAALDRALDVFWRRGYSGAGLAELTAAMSLSPPSLYAAFGDKRGLFLAALDRYGATRGAEPLNALRATEGDAKLRAFLAAAVDLSYDGERGRGCFAACVAADAAGDDEAIRNRLNVMLRAYEEALDRASDGAGPAGSLLLAAIHAIAVRARAGAAREDVEALAEDLGSQLSLAG